MSEPKFKKGDKVIWDNGPKGDKVRTVANSHLELGNEWSYTLRNGGLISPVKEGELRPLGDVHTPPKSNTERDPTLS